MRRLNATLTGMLAVIALLSAGCRVVRGGEAIRARVAVNWKQTHQTIVGFGGTMGWIHPHKSKRKEVLDLLFKDLGASVLRIRALGGEGGDELSLEPANDNDDPNTFDWKRLPIEKTEAANAILIKGAQARGVTTVVPVTWSPPGWMKTSGTRAGGSGDLKEKLLDEYAELWAAYVVGMKRAHKIDIKLISIQNEPDLTYFYPTCGFSPRLYARAMKTVADRFARDKLDVKVLGPDTCRIYNLERRMKEIERLKIAPGTPMLTHLYDLSIPFDRVKRDAARWRTARALAKKYKRPLWLMETANYLSPGVKPASYKEALIWAEKIHWALVEGNCEVVCYWQLFFDKKGEALLYCAKTGQKKYEITPKFYTSKNFFRFVRPGMLRATANCRAEALRVSAFREKKGAPRRRVIVAVNTSETACNLSLNVDRSKSWRRHVTTASQKCVDAGDIPAQGPVALPPKSVTTLVSK